jgi:hypothetical protein
MKVTSEPKLFAPNLCAEEPFNLAVSVYIMRLMEAKRIGDAARFGKGHNGYCQY